MKSVKKSAKATKTSAKPSAKNPHHKLGRRCSSCGEAWPCTASKGKSKISEARDLHARIYTLLDSAVEEAGRKLMAAHPIAGEYVQAMGSWFFVVTFSDAEGTKQEVTASSWSDLSRFYSPDYTSTATMAALKKLGQALEVFSANVMRAYEDLLESRYTAMRFTATGKIVEHW